jgi:hypothetical protein
MLEDLFNVRGINNLLKFSSAAVWSSITNLMVGFQCNCCTVADKCCGLKLCI